MRKGNNQHILPRERGRWAVKTEGAVRDTKIYENKSAAIRLGTNIAKNKKAEVFIHGRSGRIQERNTYGKDKFPPKG